MNRIQSLAKTIILIFLASTQLTSAQNDHSDFATKRLSEITARETELYRKIETDPEFYSKSDLERKVNDLIDAYRSYLSDHSEDTSALILYGKLLRRVGEDKQAFKAFLKADELDPKIAVVKQQIGTYLAEAGKATAAFPFYLQAIELQPNVAIYHFGLGELLNSFRSDFVENQIFTDAALDREMLNAFRKAANLASANFDLQMRAGEAYYDLVNLEWESALLYWKELRKTQTDDLRLEIVALHQALVLTKLLRFKDASKMLEQIKLPALEASKADVQQKIKEALNENPRHSVL